MLIHANVSISSITIGEKTVSVKFAVAGAQDIEALSIFKKEQARFVISCDEKDTVWFLGRIASLALREKVTFVVHTTVSPIVIGKLVNIRTHGCVLRIEEWVERGSDDGKGQRRQKRGFDQSITETLAALLVASADKYGVAAEDLIERLSTFEKDGRLHRGKRSLDRISERQKAIVYDKLNRLLRKRNVSDIFIAWKAEENQKSPRTEGA